MKKSWNVQLSNTNKNLLFKLSRFLKRQSVARVYDLPLSWSWHCLLHRVWCKSFSCFWKTLRELQVQEPSLRYLILPKLRWNHWRCLTGKGNFREAINNLALLLHAAAWSPLSKDNKTATAENRTEQRHSSRHWQQDPSWGLVTPLSGVRPGERSLSVQQAPERSCFL